MTDAAELVAIDVFNTARRPVTRAPTGCDVAPAATARVEWEMTCSRECASPAWPRSSTTT
jgi:hypothetical protein